jgi:hypothetical protein
MSFAGLERRVAALERPSGIPQTPEEAALEILNDNETGLVAEFVALLKSGHSLEEIQQMMEKESFMMAVDAIERADAEYKRLTRPSARPKREGILLEPTPAWAELYGEDGEES